MCLKVEQQYQKSGVAEAETTADRSVATSCDGLDSLPSQSSGRGATCLILKGRAICSSAEPAE